MSEKEQAEKTKKNAKEKYLKKCVLRKSNNDLQIHHFVNTIFFKKAPSFPLQLKDKKYLTKDIRVYVIGEIEMVTLKTKILPYLLSIFSF